MVDLIEPAPKNRLRPRGRASIGDADDLQAVEIEELAWLLNSSKQRAVVIDERGFPLEMVVPDPRAFALHKAWLAARDDREPINVGATLRKRGSSHAWRRNGSRCPSTPRPSRRCRRP